MAEDKRHMDVPKERFCEGHPRPRRLPRLCPRNLQA